MSVDLVHRLLRHGGSLTVLGGVGAVAAVFPNRPGPPDAVSAALLVAAIVTVGLPHGALDVAVAKATASPLAGRPMVAAHAVAGVGAAAAWLLAPAVALVGFLAVSAWHFGRSDLAAAGSGSALARLREVTWGVAVLAGPIGLHASDAAAVVSTVGVDVPDAAIRLGPGAAAVAVMAHVVVRVRAWWIGDGLRPRAGVADLAARPGAAIVLAATVVRTDPVVGFACYFALWHSLGHLVRALDSVRDAGVVGRRTIAETVAFSAVPVLAVAGLATGWAPARTPEGVAALAFAGLSALTLPHLFVVEGLLTRGRAAGFRARAGSRDLGRSRVGPADPGRPRSWLGAAGCGP